MRRHRIIDYKEMSKILYDNGYNLVRKKGSHRIFSNNKNTISIPYDLNCIIARRLIKENNLIVKEK